MIIGRKGYFVVIAIFLALSLFTGCGKKPVQKDKIIATVNGEPIYVNDLNREIAMNLKRDPMFQVTPQTLSEQLNILINRRLLIQEAKKKKLDETQRFTDTIKTFWEQTLIRDLISYKNKELEKSSLTDEERQSSMNTWLLDIRKKADIKINDNVLSGYQYKP